MLVTVPLQGVAPATPRSRLLMLDLRGISFRFRPGQAVLIAAHGQAARRPYSIACSPEQAELNDKIELLVGVDSAGTLGPHLPSSKPGASIDVEGPVGSFTFPDSLTHERLLFVGGGTGIAPLRAMADHAMRKYPSNPLALLYSARRADELAFIDEFYAHAKAGRLELHQTVTRNDGDWQGGRGRIGRAHFEAVLHEPRHTLCFVCGPPLMVHEAMITLEELGVPRDAVRTEQWTTKT